MCSETHEFEKFMREAMLESEIAASAGDVPVGAVIVKDGEIIARAHNMVEVNRRSSSHAELLAIEQAERFIGGKWLKGCEIFVTLEPCAMCAGAMVLARLDAVRFGAEDPKNGACGSVFNVVQEQRLNHEMKVSGGILRKECSAQLSEFFRSLRLRKQKIRNRL